MSDIKGIEAATVVIFRRGPQDGSPEILMVIRSKSLSFAGGAAVFPGGRVDPSDHQLAASIDSDLERGEAAHRIAAIRETLEETGLVIGLRGTIDARAAAEARALLLEHGALAPVLEAMEWSLALDELIPFARWFPKNEDLPRVFDTRFYIADLGTGAVDIDVDRTENTRLFWITAQDALAQADAGEISVIFPTRRNLERLARFSDFVSAAQECSEIPVSTIVPFGEVRDGEPWICIPDNAGYPVTGERLSTMKRG